MKKLLDKHSGEKRKYMELPKPKHKKRITKKAMEKYVKAFSDEQKLTVKTSKETGYKYLEAPKVKEITDKLIDALNTHLNWHKEKDPIITEHLCEDYDEPEQGCECKNPDPIKWDKLDKVECVKCGKVIKPKKEVLEEVVLEDKPKDTKEELRGQITLIIQSELDKTSASFIPEFCLEIADKILSLLQKGK